MDSSEFITRLRNKDQTISSKQQEDGSFKIEAPHYDIDEFKAFLPAFRQVAVSRNETVYLRKVSSMVGKYADEEIRHDLETMRDLFKRMEGNKPGMSLGRDGHPESYTSYQLLDALVNGLIFHADARHDQAIEFIDTSDAWHYMWLIVGEIIIPVMSACLFLANVIIVPRGYIHSSDIS